MSVFSGKKLELFQQGGRDRLAVSAIDALPSDQPVKYINEFLKNNGSFDMTVNGSLASPIVFEKVFNTGEVGFMEQIILQLRDGGSSKLDDFGSRNGLDNGLLFELKTGGNITSSFNVKTNTDLISAADNIIEIGQFSGAPVIVYTFNFKKNISFNHNDDNDFIRVSIRDNLQSIESLRIAFKRWEVI